MSEQAAQMNFKPTPELLARIDAEVERLRALHPGMKVTRSDVLRMALNSWLEMQGTKKAAA